MSFVSSKGNILCRLVKIELYKIFAIIYRAIKGLHCIQTQQEGCRVQFCDIKRWFNKTILLTLFERWSDDGFNV